MKKAFLNLLLASFIYALFYYLLISESAKNEDVFTYYTSYSLDNSSFGNFFDAIEGFYFSGYPNTFQLSFSNINFIAHFYFGILANLDFNSFLFVNMFAISFLAFWTLRKVTNAHALTIFLMLFSLPMLVNIHFTWRQIIAQLLILLITLSSLKYKRAFIFALATLIHPLGFASANEKNLFHLASSAVSRLMLTVSFFMVGVFISKFTTIASSVKSEAPMSSPIHFAWLSIFILYSLPLLVKNSSKKLSDTNFFIFFSLLSGYSLFSTEVIGVSRLAAAGSISSMFYAIINYPKSIYYYRILSPFIFVSYLSFVR